MEQFFFRFIADTISADGFQIGKHESKGFFIPSLKLTELIGSPIIKGIADQVVSTDAFKSNDLALFQQIRRSSYWGSRRMI